VDASFPKEPARKGRDVILVIMPKLVPTLEVYRGLSGELSAELDVVPSEFDPDGGIEKLARVMDANQPKALVLMDNRVLALYRQYQRSRPAGTKFPPAIALMTAFLDEEYRYVQNATGISYEVPGVTLFTQLRSLVRSPVRRIGVVHRHSFAGYLAKQQQLASREDIQIQSIAVSDQPTADEVEGALESLKEQSVDALWVLNDNVLLSPELVGSAWLPEMKHNSIPVIVGVRQLLSLGKPFGTFAIVPDHAALGVQAAGMIFDLADKNWASDIHGIAQPLSTKTLANFKQAEKLFALHPQARQRIDEAVE